MEGITSVGAYVPMYRLSQEDVTTMWGSKSVGGEKTVA